MGKQSVIVLGVSLGSMGLGVLVGYKIAERRLSHAFDERLAKETAGMREFYATVKKPYATPQEAVADLVESKEESEILDKKAYHKIVTSQGYQPAQDPMVDFVEQPKATFNVFSKNERDPDIPYIISEEEFMENQRDWQQITLTFYEGDNVLTDHREDVIEDPVKTIGSDAIQSFGLQSSDPSTVHVCNEKLGILFEVVKHESSYTQEVLGLEESAPSLPSGRARSDT